MRHTRRARLIAASADVSASAKPTTYPDYFVNLHDRPRWIFHYPDEKVKKHHHADHKLTTTTQCTAKATALQLYDGATVTDYSAPNSSEQTANCRIIESTVIFEAQKAVFEHHIALEGL